jgi:hypothetical protein
MLEARKYNRNRIILFVAFSLLTLGLCLYCTMAYYSIEVEIVNYLAYDAKTVSDPVVKILEREQQHFHLSGGVFYYPMDSRADSLHHHQKIGSLSYEK